MELYVLDKNFESVYIIDTYESIIWTDRYCGYGDFEIYASATSELKNYAKADYYLWQKDSEHMMIIEETTIMSDASTGSHIKIVGRSLESLLDRRIVWGMTQINGSLQDGIAKIIRENFTSPSVANRKISNFIFEKSTDSRITSLRVSKQYTGDTVYDIIQELCDACGMGFKVTLNSSNQFVLRLYMGTDRSYNQTTNPFVTFAPSFDNIINSNYFENKALLKNVALVAGEDEGDKRRAEVVGVSSGLDRRELFVDARDIQSEVDGEPLTDSQYIFLLKIRGVEKLQECPHVTSFEGEVDASIMFRYGVDFFMGDYVELANEYGQGGKARIDELVFSQDTNEGFKVVPTFVILDEDAASYDSPSSGGNTGATWNPTSGSSGGGSTPVTPPEIDLTQYVKFSDLVPITSEELENMAKQ